MMKTLLFCVLFAPFVYLLFERMLSGCSLFACYEGVRKKKLTTEALYIWFANNTQVLNHIVTFSLCDPMLSNLGRGERICELVKVGTGVLIPYPSKAYSWYYS
ncbi:hypothetical protein GGS20DRAFT_554861 [Poronia punctata]|nr:hypothetical protein GGS20DRAFT_554861 [Poronia punctata]